jgi:hypothetical protein
MGEPFRRSPSPLSALLLPLLFSRVRCFLRRDGLRLVSFRWDEECLVRLEGDLVLLAIGLSSAHKEEVFLSSLLLDNLWCFSLFFKDDAAIVPFSTGAAHHYYAGSAQHRDPMLLLAGPFPESKPCPTLTMPAFDDGFVPCSYAGRRRSWRASSRGSPLPASWAVRPDHSGPAAAGNDWSYYYWTSCCCWCSCCWTVDDSSVPTWFRWQQCSSPERRSVIRHGIWPIQLPANIFVGTNELVVRNLIKDSFSQLDALR